jgi:predicted PurR-regulated permease PerM
MYKSYTLQKIVYLLAFAFLLVAGLYYAKIFLVPVCFGGLLAMLFLPMSRWFERKKIQRLWPSFCASLFSLVL